MLHMFHSSIIGISWKDIGTATPGTMTSFREEIFGNLCALSKTKDQDNFQSSVDPVWIYNKSLCEISFKKYIILSPGVISQLDYLRFFRLEAKSDPVHWF